MNFNYGQHELLIKKMKKKKKNQIDTEFGMY